MRGNFGHYQVERQLGYGGFGRVYLALDTVLERQVALKALHEHLNADEEARKSFMREARAMAKLSHPNIVTIHHVDNTHHPVIVMEYVAGETLAALIARKKVFSVQEALPILRQVAAALDAAHALGVVHRDVKPANILVSADSQVKLTDFGLAKIRQATKASMTITGTVFYMSPEQISRKEIGPTSDVYSLGVVAYEMLTGRVPFLHEDEMVVLNAHCTLPPPDPNDFDVNLPKAVVAVLTGALAKEPDERYQTAGAFVKALEWTLHSEAPTRHIKPGKQKQVRVKKDKIKGAWLMVIVQKIGVVYSFALLLMLVGLLLLAVGMYQHFWPIQ